MAIRFAKQNGNWSSTSTWDGGLTIPTTGDEVYLNGYNIAFDQNATVGFIANSITPVGLFGSFIPDMTSNTTPAGVGQAFAGANNVNAWKVFRKGILTFKSNSDGYEGSTLTQAAQIGYQFNVAKNIQRYSWYQNQNSVNRPRTWTFEGSNDGVTWVILHTVTSATNQAIYSSPVISNPSSYTYYRLNITATQGQHCIINALDMSESIDLSNGYGAGGSATVNNNLTITADFYLGTAATNLFTVPALSPNQVTFIGNAPGDFAGAGNNNPALINMTGTGTLNYIGNIRATNQNATARGIQSGAGSTINFTGDILGSRVSSTFSGTNSQGIVCASGTILNFVGSITAAETGMWNRGISTFTNAVVTITGDVNGGVGTDAGRTNSGLNLGGGTVIMTGNVYAGANSPGIVGGADNTTVVRLTGNLYNWTDGTLAAIHRYLFLESNNMQWNFKKNDLTNNILYTPGVNTGHPATNNVRTGIVYGPTNNLTGTCAVPPAGAVSLGVPVDNTTGTAYLSGNDISAAVWDTQTTNLSASGSIGERLKNASTVDTTAATVAAYDI